MKKWLIALIVVLCVLVVGGGTAFGIFAYNKNKTNNGIYTAKVDYLDEEYTVGDDIIYRGFYQSDKQLSSVKYKLDNGTETAFTSTTGESKDNKELKTSNGKYYINTGTETISASTLTEGKHILTIYVYEGTTRIVLAEKVITFKAVS